MSNKKKIGLLFGSFNPIHIGHLFMGEMALESGVVDEVKFIVSPASPYKMNSPDLAPEKDRFAMAALACSYNEKFSVSNMEFFMEKPSYTYLTLQKLQYVNPNAELYFICGTDVYVDIPNWHGGKEVIEVANFLVYPRNSTSNYTPEEMKHKTTFLNGVPNLEISATFLREQIKKGRTTKHLLPEEVQYHIEKHNLYK
jgi:nicotinate-nucleotide adenylyltransferase